MLPELLQRWREVLLVEEDRGYGNSAVMGGTDGWMRAEIDGALHEVHSGVLPPTAEFRLQRLEEWWAGYRGSDERARRSILARTREILGDLDGADDYSGEATASEMDGRDFQLNEFPAPYAERNSERPTRTVKLGSTLTERPTEKPTGKATEPKAPARPCSLDDDLIYLKGIGPKRAEVLATKLGLRTVFDLLYHFPARYEDRRVVKPLAQVEIGEKESVCVKVLHDPMTRAMGGRMGAGRKLTRVRVGDGSAHADLQWWSQPWREKQFQKGMELFVYGKMHEFNGMIQIDSPEFEILGDNDGLQVGRIVPVYPMTDGLFQVNIRKAIFSALERCVDVVPDALPLELREQFGLRELPWCLQQIHFPDSIEAKEEARKRLLFEELFLLQVALAQKKVAAHFEEVGVRHAVDDDLIRDWASKLPFKLTGAQKRVMNEIRRDLKSPRPMNRLLHGDVGSGKTVVAAYALWMAHAAGYQGALLAPTEILAEQHFTVMKRLLEPHGVQVALLEGSLKSKNKRLILADIAEGRSTVVVGTHAIIQENVEFRNLSICVVDEQHRFGVMQRQALAHKGVQGLRPDVLVMTATPIPRTMALTVYGDLDVSVLDELPPGRQPVKTISVRPNQREKAYKFIRDAVKQGRQAYVVCPLVEESEKLSQLTAATALAERLRMEELHDMRVGLLHGQMGVYERDEEMELFRAGMRDVLVSTTVIEVGVDVPNATVMLIEDAERFGLSQLHQLRGRVGRGEHSSTCILMGSPKGDEARARLRVMVKTQNGFEIAEHDLELRGPGEFYGTRQSGMPDFRLANIVRDVEVIALAREAAMDLVKSDPHLESDEHEHLRSALRRFWGEKVSLVQVS